MGLGLALASSALAEEDPKKMRPQPGDHLVFVSGDREGQKVRPQDLPVGGPQEQAMPIDPKTGTIREGSPYNLVLVLRLDPALMGDETRERAADGVVAYSGICKHQGCPVTMWLKEEALMFCACHGSQYDPRHAAAVVAGPAPRRLPALPLRLDGEFVAVAETFTGSVGPQDI